jgi:hypothetical protein
MTSIRLSDLARALGVALHSACARRCRRREQPDAESFDTAPDSD